MRFALWFLALFGVAVAGALFAGNNHATVTLFWWPHRVDVSLNLVLLVLVVGFVALHLALRTLSALIYIPAQARRWRLQQKERAIYATLLEALSHQIGGRFVRSRKAAELVVSLEETVTASGEKLPHAGQLRIIAHLLAAESAHALQDRAVRDAHFQEALERAQHRDAQDARDGVLLRAARWAYEDRDAAASLKWMDQLPLGAARRTLALRLRFKAARLAGQAKVALETVRSLTKHRAFSEVSGKSMARGLAIELIRAAHDLVQIQQAWGVLDETEKAMPDVALEAAERWLAHEGNAAQSRAWLLPIWEAMVNQSDALSVAQQVRLVRVLERGFSLQAGAPDAEWLSRVEAAQMAHPRDAVLQYLAGIMCMRLGLWGKSQQILKHALALLQHPELKRDAWQALAVLAEQRQDTQAATDAYRQALKEAAKS